jgi:DNA-binding FadR family transcriptional regulator
MGASSDYQAIVDALVQGDGKTAAELLRSHLETAQGKGA